MALVQRHVGDVSTSDLKSATDEVLAILKTEELTDAERKREIEGVVDRLSEESFNALTVLGQQLIDYAPEDEYQGEIREEVADVNVELDDSESEGGSESESEPDEKPEEPEEAEEEEAKQPAP